MMAFDSLNRIKAVNYMRNILLILFIIPAISVAETDNSNGQKHSGSYQEEVRIYRNPEERREAGVGRQLTDWLKVSGLLELEKEFIENNFSSNEKDKDYRRLVSTIQLGLDASIFDWLTAEVVFETENGDHHHSKIDEAFLNMEFDNFEIEVGKLTVPFGEYYSHFITGPLIEFGEARKDAAVVDYSFSESLEITGFVLKSEAKKLNRNNDYDWGAGINFSSESEALRLGIGYLSDLAESDERFLGDENDVYEKRVSAWNAYILAGFNKFELTAELVQANRGFTELDRNSDKPFAYNFELAYFPTYFTQLAVRMEQSDEFADQPRRQYGISGTWRFSKNVTVSAEYLHAEYKDDYILKANSEDLDDRDLIAAQLSIEF